MDKRSTPATPTDIVVHVGYVSTADEIANAATHALGFLLSLAAMLFFWQVSQGHALGLRLACIVFTLTMATVYLCSTLSHAVHEPRWRHRMRAWDQGTIYLLIAGTYSPFVWQSSPQGWTGVILALVWGTALFGFYLKVIASYRVNTASTITYVLLGWLPAIPLIFRTPTVCLVWMFLGGLSYTLGILFWLRSDHARFSHAAWHLMVILGSACHCYAIYVLLNLS